MLSNMHNPVYKHQEAQPLICILVHVDVLFEGFLVAMASLLQAPSNEHKTQIDPGYISSSPEFDYHTAPTITPSYTTLAAPNQTKSERSKFMNRRKTPKPGVNEKKLEELRDNIELKKKPIPSTTTKEEFHQNIETQLNGYHNENDKEAVDNEVNAPLVQEDYNNNMHMDDGGCCVSIFFGKMFGGLCNNEDEEPMQAL